MHQKKQRVWELLLVFLKIGAFTFGGGYAMIPLFMKEHGNGRIVRGMNCELEAM